MRFFEHYRNQIFWSLQLVGWSAWNLTSIFLIKELSPSFTIYSTIAGIFIGVLSTSLLRWFLKRYVNFENFTGNDFLKISVSVLVAALIFGLLNFLFGYFYHEFGPELTELDRKILKTFDSFGLIVFSSIFNVGAWAACYLVIKLILRFNQNRMERLELNATLKQAQLNTLKGQINPHFMFNSLNNIRGLMLEDVERSREMLTKLSEMLRYSLTKNNVDAIALSEELEMVDNYIALSKIQFEDRLTYHSTIENGTEELPIPPMLVQLLVENAAKHGISALKQGGYISVKTFAVENLLHIEVKNSGKLRISKDSTQLGLRNIKQRLKLLYGDAASFNLSEVGDEVVAQLKIPFK